MVALNDIIDQKNKVNTFHAKRMKRKKSFQVDESPRFEKWSSSW